LTFDSIKSLYIILILFVSYLYFAFLFMYQAALEEDRVRLKFIMYINIKSLN